MYLLATPVYAHNLPSLIRDDIAHLQSHPRLSYAGDTFGLRQLADRAADAWSRGDLAASQALLGDWQRIRSDLGRYPHRLISLYGTSPFRRPRRRYRLRTELVRK
ncbi:hypothetical protein [Gordonia sihwensis]|uniref:hypothetical protein n=1 Tax=Gordonia sihwensis TaxID=173559 RepID=UPI0005EE0CF8|nr:hypothetical protein [Gordonia sihwensis]KJR10445.1 hypothetical protein UG54_00115 [Gordonia sihwensis]